MSLLDPTTSTQKAPAAELLEVVGDTRLEKQWYADSFEYPRYRDDNDLALGARHGYLVMVGITPDIAPLKRFIDPALKAENPAYLLPNSFFAYRAFGRLWRRELEQRNIFDARLRLASVSFVRTVKKQAELVSDPNLYADPDSTHCLGAPWDLDTRNYYTLNSENQLLSVTDQDEVYSPDITEAAITVSERLHYAGLANRIIEYVNTPRRCLHIAPNPEVETKEWLALAQGHLEV